jgi:ComF family protein
MAGPLQLNHAVTELFIQTRDALVSIFFPADCRLCERLLIHASRVPICGRCLSSFHILQGQICDRCGQPIATPSFAHHAAPPIAPDVPARRLCPICQVRPYRFDQARSYALYDKNLVRAILLLKFEKIEPLGVWFAQRLAGVAADLGSNPLADVVVPVPLHRTRERERGYNQVGLIAKPLAKRLRLPYSPKLLARIKPRPDKHLLTLPERWDAVRGAFAIAPGSRVDNLRFLLVDDVLTTGATLDACAKVLRDAGAKSVIGLTVARAARHGTDIPNSSPEDAR